MYRHSLGHICTMASCPTGAGYVRENKSGQCVISRVSTSQASASASKGCLILDAGTQGCKLLPGRAACPETTGGSGVQVCKEGATSDPPMFYVQDYQCVICTDKNIKYSPLKGNSLQCHFQTCMHLFLLWNTKKDILKNAGNKTILETTDFMIMI